MSKETRIGLESGTDVCSRTVSKVCESENAKLITDIIDDKTGLSNAVFDVRSMTTDTSLYPESHLKEEATLRRSKRKLMIESPDSNEMIQKEPLDQPQRSGDDLNPKPKMRQPIEPDKRSRYRHDTSASFRTTRLTPVTKPDEKLISSQTPSVNVTDKTPNVGEFPVLPVL